MFKLDSRKKSYPLLAALIGLASFLVSGVVIGLISLITNEGLILILGVPFGSMLMLLLLNKLDKKKLVAMLIGSELGALTGILIGFMAGELIKGVITLIIPSLSELSLQIVPNIIVLIVADAIFGSVMSLLLYGKKSAIFFITACALASIPFGLLLSMPIDVAWISFNQNLLFMITSFGATTGFSTGLYSVLKLNNKAD